MFRNEGNCFKTANILARRSSLSTSSSISQLGNTSLRAILRHYSLSVRGSESWSPPQRKSQHLPYPQPYQCTVKNQARYSCKAINFFHSSNVTHSQLSSGLPRSSHPIPCSVPSLPWRNLPSSSRAHPPLSDNAKRVHFTQTPNKKLFCQLRLLRLAMRRQSYHLT
jgi:hypothetical protein